jgi:PhzF family phenazine biosynthesis protein
MGLSLFQVDAFTHEPFRGNPAAVTVHDQPMDESFMQSVASEMNLSETAFVLSGDGSYRLRWFTPVAEVDLCGHATLAAAHVLWEQGIVDRRGTIPFDTLSGRLEVARAEDRIEMDFPAERSEPAGFDDVVRRAVGMNPVDVQKNRLDYMVVLGSEESVRTLKPDLNAIVRLGSRGMIVTAPSGNPGYDFVSRYFAPRYGIPEDPVTGSAHCCLGPYWSDVLKKDELTGYQASVRGGTVHVTCRGDRVTIGGRAVTTARIDLYLTSD